MSKKNFAEAIQPDDKRLKDPHLAVFIVPTEEGPKVPLIGRNKVLKNADGSPLLDNQNKPMIEIWYDLPGGKSDPIFHHNKIIGVESGALAAQRETGEETGLFVSVGDKIGENSHPARPGLTRHFYGATHEGGKFDNKVPDEHLFVFMADPENAISLLGERIPKEVQDYIRTESAQISNRNNSPETPAMMLAVAS